MKVLTHLETPAQSSHRFPQFLPDGRHFLYYVTGSPEVRGVYVGSLDGSQTHRLIPGADSPAVFSTGHLLFVRQETLFAQNFNPVQLTVSGNLIPVAEHLSVIASNVAPLSASDTGTIVFRAGSSNVLRQLKWFDRSGKEVGNIGDPDAASPLFPSVSPNGKLLALQRTKAGNADIWVLDTVRGVPNRFTFDPATDSYPTWSYDSSRIIFSSNRKGAYALYQMSANRPSSQELVLATSANMQTQDWSSANGFVLYRTPDSKMGYDLFAFQADGDKKELKVVATDYDEREGQFSPDGKWIAYQSNKSNRYEIYVQAFPGPGSVLPISTNGGTQVRWGRDGKELFYIALDNRLMSVPIRVASDGQTIEPGAPIPLFLTSVGGALQSSSGAGHQYAVSDNGQRFLMNTFVETSAEPITVILNWKPKP